MINNETCYIFTNRNDNVFLYFTNVLLDKCFLTNYIKIVNYYLYLNFYYNLIIILLNYVLLIKKVYF